MPLLDDSFTRKMKQNDRLYRILKCLSMIKVVIYIYIYRYIKPVCWATRWGFYVLFFLNCCRNYSRMWCFFCIVFFSKWEFFSDVEMLSDMSVIPIWSTRSLCSCSDNHIFLWEIFHFDLFSFWIEAQFSLL